MKYIYDICGSFIVSPLSTSASWFASRSMFSSLGKTSPRKRKQGTPTTSELRHGARWLVSACLEGSITAVSHHIRAGADVNQWSDLENPGWAPIHVACRSQSSAVLALLLDNGADVNLLTQDGLCPLDIACAKGAKGIVKLLCKYGADVNALGTSGMAPIHNACNSANATSVAILLRNGADANLPAKDGSRPLHIACATGVEKIIRILLKHGADVNAFSANGVASIHRVCTDRLRWRNPAANGSRSSTISGACPLHVACAAGVRESIVRILLENGADVNAVRQTDGSSPLHLACNLYRRDLVDLLLDQQPNINVDMPDYSGRTPLHITFYNYHWWHSASQPEADYYSIIQSLLKHGADVNACSCTPPPDIQQLKNNDDDPGTTLLHIATLKDDIKLAQILLSNGASPDSTDAQGRTPLQLAKKLGFSRIAKLLEKFLPNNDKETLIGNRENQSESVPVDWRKLTPYDPYFQQDPTIAASSLPVHSVPEVDHARNVMGNWIKRVVAVFTALESLESVQVDSDFESIRDNLMQEWQQARSCIIGIFGVDIAAYALSPDSLFQVSRIGKVAIGASGLTAGIAALCVQYLLCRFSLEPSEFRAAAMDIYDTFVCFAILSRVPLTLVIISMAFLAMLLMEVAYRLSPTMTLIVGVAIAALVFLQYIGMILDWTLWILVMIYLHFSQLLKAACQWLIARYERVV